MHNELSNLLPPERERIIARSYTIRFVTVVAIVIAVLIGVAAALLLPSSVFLVNSEKTKTDRLASMESTISSADEQLLAVRLESLTAEAATLVELGSSPSASSLMRQILLIPRPGITLAGLSYSTAMAKKPSTIIVSGVAATREALRGYQLALQGASFAKTADLPVSAYAKDSQIQFSITLTLVP